MTNRCFILNKHAHYFVVNGNIKQEDLESCDLFNTLPELLLAAAQISEIDIEEIEGNQYTFSYSSKLGQWLQIDARGVTTPIITEKPIEEYLSDWSL